MPNDRKYSIVMTACVDPSAGSAIVERADPHVRIKDYLASLRHWMSFDDPRCERVILLENSGYPLDQLQALAEECGVAGRNFKAIHVADNHIPAGVHYGYAELAMLDAARETEPTWGASEILVKVTGRLVFPRLQVLMDNINDSVEFMADARNRNIASRRTATNGLLTTQLLVFTPAFYAEHLYGLRHDLRGSDDFSSHIESMTYKRLFSLHKERPGEVLFRFPVSCEPSGFGATHNTEYGSGADGLKAALRSFSRSTIPNVWV